MSVCEQNYRRLARLLDLDAIKDGRLNQLRDPGHGPWMRFDVEVVRRPAPDKAILSLAHYYEQAGDLVPDPEMEVFVDFQRRTVEALSITQATGRHATVYEGTAVNLREKREQNSFLGIWLLNLRRQGYQPKPVEILRQWPPAEREEPGPGF